MPASFVQPPTAFQDFTRDWTAALGGTDSIAASEWDVPAGLTVGADEHAPTFDAATATIWLTSDDGGRDHVVTNTVTTAEGRTLVGSFRLAIKG